MFDALPAAMDGGEGSTADPRVANVVRQGADDENKVCLKVKLPCTGEYCYKTCCGKFFPIATCHKTKKGECLFIAVMVEPCKGK